jgi:hypothetical protein
MEPYPQGYLGEFFHQTQNEGVIGARLCTSLQTSMGPYLLF